MAVQIERRTVADVGLVGQLTLASGHQVDVVVHDDGARELAMRGAGAGVRSRLTTDEADALADLLCSPGARVAAAHEPVAGLIVERLRVPPRSWLAGHELGEAHLYEKTGASVLAVLRGDAVQPMPRLDYVLMAGDEVLTSGTREAVDRAGHILDGTG